MSIRDLQSNYKPTPLDNNTAIAASTDSFTDAVDLSTGYTTLVAYTVTTATGVMLSFEIQFSVDAAFTSPFVNPDTDFYNDNQVITSKGNPTPQPYFTQFGDFFLKINNPPSEIGSGSTAYRYARLKVTESFGQPCVLNSIVLSGPQRLSALKN